MPFVESRVVSPLADANCEAHHDVTVTCVESGKVDRISVIVLLDEAADAFEPFSATVAGDV